MTEPIQKSESDKLAPKKDPAYESGQQSLFSGGPLDGTPQAKPPETPAVEPVAAPSEPPAAPAEPPAEPPQNEPPAESPEVAALRGQLDAQNETIRQLLVNSQAQPADRPKPPEKPADAIPDVIQDPEGFKRWHEQDRAYRDWQMESRIAAVQAQSADDARQQRLWTLFQSKYADLSRDPELVDAAWRAESRENPGALTSDEATVDAVAARMRRALGAPATPTTPAEQAHGTAGLAGRSPATVTLPTTPKEPEEGEPKPLSEVLGDLQQSMGDFY